MLNLLLLHYFHIHYIPQDSGYQHYQFIMACPYSFHIYLYFLNFIFQTQNWIAQLEMLESFRANYQSLCLIHTSSRVNNQFQILEQPIGPYKFHQFDTQPSPQLLPSYYLFHFELFNLFKSINVCSMNALFFPISQPLKLSNQIFYSV